MGNERKGREGSRWINERPSADEVSRWFTEAVRLPEGLDHDRYISGVTLIAAKEREDVVVGFKENGVPVYSEVQHIVYVPYVKVETRVQFFHDLMEAHRDDWLGVIEPVVVEKPDPSLPPGFFKFAADNTPFVCCSMKVTVFKRDTVRWCERRNPRTGELERFREGETIIDAPPATKIIPTRGRYGADPMSVMKAETGAIGRALGMAGMLIVPGTGVATAEDMREAIDMAGTPASAREESEDVAPPEGQRGIAIREPSHDELVGRAVELIEELRNTDESRHTAFLAWVEERGYRGKVRELPDPALKGIIKKLEKDMEEAQRAAKAAEKEAAKAARAAEKK